MKIRTYLLIFTLIFSTITNSYSQKSNKNLAKGTVIEMEDNVIKLEILDHHSCKGVKKFLIKNRSLKTIKSGDTIIFLPDKECKKIFIIQDSNTGR